MFENICSLPLSSELFAQALHPTLPILSVGLSGGHVQTYRLPDPSAPSASVSPEPTSETGDLLPSGTSGRPRRSSLRRTSSASAASDSGLGEIETAWRTRRHKGSCRTLAYSPDGDVLFSAGTDGLVKAARSEDGRVIAKIMVVPDENGDSDPPMYLHVLTPTTLVLATDSSAVHFYDIRLPIGTMSAKPVATHHPHTDFLSSLTPLPASDTSTSGFPKQFVSTGGTTLAITDIRRGVLVRSEDQEEELTTSIFVDGLKKGGTSKGEKVLVGDGDGVLSLWERGVWDDQDERIVVDRGGEGIESLVSVPESAISKRQGEHKLLAAGLGDGRIRFVRLGPNKVVHEWDIKHDDVEGVVALGFDVGGRMVSGGGEIVKVWRETIETPAMLNGFALGKRAMAGSEGSDDEDDDADSDEEGSKDKTSKRRKRKRGRGKDRNGGQEIMAFKGLV